VLIGDTPASVTHEKGYVVLAHAPARARVSVHYPLRRTDENVVAADRNTRFSGEATRSLVSARHRAASQPTRTG